MRGDADWILTSTGRAYFPLAPSSHDVCIEDIAHGLSQLCRYAGQTKHFYSVAEHSVHVSYMVPKPLALEALLHDATEAYCSDIVRPLKRLLPDYMRIERLNDLAIREHFHLPPHEHPLIKQADTDILLSEKAVLLPPIPEGRTWAIDGVLNEKVCIGCWMPPIAKAYFLARFDELTRMR